MHDLSSSQVRLSFNELKEALFDKFPFGHPMFNQKMLNQMELQSRKNHGYAMGGAALGNFDRVASILRNYPSFPPNRFSVVLMYVLKHFDKIMWDVTNARVPSDEALTDMSVYMIIMSCMVYDENHKTLNTIDGRDTPR